MVTLYTKTKVKASRVACTPDLEEIRSVDEQARPHQSLTASRRRYGSKSVKTADITQVVRGLATPNIQRLRTGTPAVDSLREQKCFSIVFPENRSLDMEFNNKCARAPTLRLGGALNRPRARAGNCATSGSAASSGSRTRRASARCARAGRGRAAERAAREPRVGAGQHAVQRETYSACEQELRVGGREP
jgi:hypothetical protein